MAGAMRWLLVTLLDRTPVAKIADFNWLGY